MFGMPQVAVPQLAGDNGAARATRSAASASCTTAASTRVVPLPHATVFNGWLRQSRLPRRPTRSANSSSSSCSPSTRTWRPIVGQQITLTSTNAGGRRPAHRPADRARRRRRVRARRQGRPSPAQQRGSVRLAIGAVPERSRQRAAAHRRRSCARSRPPPGRSSPTPACRPARARASASTATRTASSTATSSTPAPIRPIPPSVPGGDHDQHDHSTIRRRRARPDQAAHLEGRQHASRQSRTGARSRSSRSPSSTRPAIASCRRRRAVRTTRRSLAPRSSVYNAVGLTTDERDRDPAGGGMDRHRRAATDSRATTRPRSPP